MSFFKNFLKRKSAKSPPEWVEEKYEPTTKTSYITHHICYGFLGSTTVPPDYIVTDQIFETAISKAKKAIQEMNITVENAAILDHIITLAALKELYSSLSRQYLSHLYAIYCNRTELQTQLQQLNDYIAIRESQLTEINTRISDLSE